LKTQRRHRQQRGDLLRKRDGCSGQGYGISMVTTAGDGAVLELKLRLLASRVPDG